MKSAMVFILFFSLASAATAQRGIRLTSRFSKRQKFLTEGSRVVYSSINRNGGMSYLGYLRNISGVGILKIVNDSTIQVDQQVIRTTDLLLIGRRNKGAGVGAAILILGGFVIVATSHTTNDAGQVTPEPGGIVLGFACETIGLVDAFSRAPKYMSRWQVDVVK